MKGEVIHCEDGRILRDMGDVISIFIPMEIRRRTGRKEIIPPEGPVLTSEPSRYQVAVSRAYVWQKWLDEGRFPDIPSLADFLKADVSFVRRVLRLALLSPKIVESILNGREPEMPLTKLLHTDVPLLWDEQERLLFCAFRDQIAGFAASHAEVVGISSDSVDCRHQNLSARHATASARPPSPRLDLFRKVSFQAAALNSVPEGSLEPTSAKMPFVESTRKHRRIITYCHILSYEGSLCIRIYEV